MRYLQVQLLGSLLVLSMVILRTITRRLLPKKHIVILWDFTMLSFLLPLFYKVKVTEGPYYLVTLKSKITTVNESIARPLQPYEMPLQILFFLGATALLVYFIFLYFISVHKFKKSKMITDSYIKLWLTKKGRSKDTLKNVTTRSITVRECLYIDSPMTFGILHPVILLPSDLKKSTEEQKSLVLEHEYHHIRHFDSMRKLLLLFTVSIHWFNPMVWLMCILYNKDIEYACDEAVLQSIGLNYKKDYSLLLIDSAKRLAPPDFLGNYLNTHPLEKRVLFIMKQKEWSPQKKLLSYVFLGCILSIMFFTHRITAYTTTIPPITIDNFIPAEIVQEEIDYDHATILEIPYIPNVLK